VKLFDDSSYVVMLGRFGDCAESVLDCLQAFHLRRVDVVENLITVG